MENKFHCQICEREIKAKKGLISHHGYTRPGGGYQTGSCGGARNLPYEISRDAIPKEILRISNFIEHRNKLLEKVKAGVVPIFDTVLGKEIEPTHPSYSNRKYTYESNLNFYIKQAEREVSRLQKRYDNWKEGDHYDNIN